MLWPGYVWQCLPGTMANARKKRSGCEETEQYGQGGKIVVTSNRSTKLKSVD